MVVVVPTTSFDSPRQLCHQVYRQISTMQSFCQPSSNLYTLLVCALRLHVLSSPPPHPPTPQRHSTIPISLPMIIFPCTYALLSVDSLKTSSDFADICTSTDTHSLLPKPHRLRAPPTSPIQQNSPLVSSHSLSYVETAICFLCFLNTLSGWRAALALVLCIFSTTFA